MWLTNRLSNDDPAIMAKAQLYALDTHLFKGINHPYAQASKFTTTHYNIQTLTRCLNQAIWAMEKQEKFEAEKLPFTQKFISVEQFFINDRSRYISPSVATAEFKEAALAFLTLYYAQDNPGYGIVNYNQRVLLSLVHESVSIAQSLRKFSYAQRKQ